VGRKDLEETHAEVLACELTIDIRDIRLNSMEEEVAGRKGAVAGGMVGSGAGYHS
jgi:hypothetical protein